MKKIIGVIIFLICSVVMYAQPTITFPMNNAVFQRNGSSSSSTATITFLGQTTEGPTPGAFDSEYWITKLDKYGSSLGYHVSPTAFFGTRSQIGTSRSYTYRLQLSIPTGWYQFSVKNGSNNAVSSIKFGVGEVFVIAGQSNAQGAGSGATHAPDVTNNYECVLSLKNSTMFWHGVDNTYYLQYANGILRPVYEKLTSSNPRIGPMGGRPWFYQKFGELMANMHGDNPIVPVMFYNVALGGTTITNWHGSMKTTEKMYSYNYSNSMNLSNDMGYPNSYYPNSTGWTPNIFGENEYKRLFTNLKDVLSFYGNIHGVRAVLWHQGESETKTILTDEFGTSEFTNVGTVPTGYSVNDYSTFLGQVIDETREILPGLGWGMSKVSLISEYRTTVGKQLFNIINPSGQVLSHPAITGNELPATSVGGSVLGQQSSLINSYIKWFTLYSDTCAHPSTGVSHRQSDYVHFSSKGLSFMAQDAYGRKTDILSLTPVLNTPPGYITITKVGSNYNVSATPPGGVTYVDKRWNYMDGLGSFTFYDPTLSNSLSDFTGMGSGGYVKDTYGRLHVIPGAYFGYLTGYKVASGKSTVVYPNPVNSTSIVEFSLDSYDSELVKFEFYSEDGFSIYSSKEKFAVGERNKYSLPFDKIKNEKIVYLHIIKNENNIERIRLLND